MQKIRVGFIGMGLRGPGLLRTVLTNFPEIEVVAICDSYPDKIEKGQNIVREIRGVDCKGYTDYREFLEDTEINTVVISASWESHVPLAIATMRAGKITALEVGGAYSVDDCWELVKTYEETKTPFMFMENCCYGKRELLASSLVKHGILGEVVYCHGAYLHDCRRSIADGINLRNYRLRNYLSRNCDNYPTHDLGPIARILNINRGNKMVSLVSLSSKAKGMNEYIKDKEEFAHLHDKKFSQGDVVQTLITCADGAVISLKLDTTLPHYYSRELTVSGTKGIFKEEGDVVYEDSRELDREKEIDHYFNTASEYEDKYLPECWKNITQEEIASGHGGMDVLMFKSFFEAVQAGKPMPLDVYDAASWMSISCLSEISIRCGGHPVEIPDFTRGNWIIRKPEDIVDFGI